MAWLLRGTCLASLTVIIATIVWRSLPSREQLQALLPSESAKPAQIEPADLPDESNLQAGAVPGQLISLQPAGDDLGQDDDLSDDQLNHPITRSLGDVIEGNRELFDQVGAGNLQQSLLAADEILSEQKVRNREAIRQINRQKRLPGRSLHLVLVTIEGLGLEGEDSLDPELMPSLHWIAQQGITIPVSAQGYAQERLSLTTGQNAIATESRIAPILWRAGYSTVVIGDAWWWNAQGAQSDWDAWLGFPDAAHTATFPELIWSNGRQLRLKANANGGHKVRAETLFAQETLAYIERHHRGRPFLLTVALRVDVEAARKPDRDADEVRLRSLREVDKVLSEIDLQLGHLSIGNHLLLIVGMSSDEDPPSTEETNLIVARAPGRLPAAAHFQETMQYVDLLPTLVDAAAVFPTPRRLSGKSRWQAWHRANLATADN